MVKLTVLYHISICIYWIFFFALYFMAASYDFKDGILRFFESVVPFLKDGETTEINQKIMRNLLILSLPSQIVLVAVTFYGVEAWRTDFSLRPVEIYYRLAFTMQLQGSLI